MAQNFLDKNGLNRYNESIANVLKEALGSKANLTDVVSRDYIDNNFVDKTHVVTNVSYDSTNNKITKTINGAITDVVSATTIGAAYTYSRTEINNLLNGYLPLPQAGTNYITDADMISYLTSNGYATQSWVTSQNYATQTWVNNQGYATQSWVTSQIPNLSNYYTISQITDILSGYTPSSVTTNLTNQLTALSNTVNNYIINGGSSGGGTDMYDLNNIYNWVHLSPNQLVFHSGATIAGVDLPYNRCFVETDMYRRNTTLFPLSSYEIRMSVNATVNNIVRDIVDLHQDFDNPTSISIYCDQTVKNYFGNELIINNDGVFDSSLNSILSSSSWNSFIAGFKDNYYKDINDGYNNHQSSIDPTKTWAQEDATKHWNEETGYTSVISDSASLVSRRACLQSITPADADEVAMLQERLTYLDSFLNSAHDKALFEYLTLTSNVILSGTLTASIYPYIKEPDNHLDPDDSTASTSRYTWVFDYKTNSWDSEPSNHLEIRLYNNSANSWSNTDNSVIYNVYSTSGYYDQLKNADSSYLNDQKYAYTSSVKNNSDQKYYFTYGEGLSKVSILKSKWITTLNAFADRVNIGTEQVPVYTYRIFLNGSELDPSVQADLDTLSGFISDYLINNDSQNVDPRITQIYVRNGQNIIYSFARDYPTAHEMFDFVSAQSSVKSLGGATGDITFNTGSLSTNEVAFSVDANNVLHGFSPAVADANPVGVIFIWPSNTAPADYLLCDGSNISQTTYSTLYGIIGNTYDDTTTQAGEFRLPDMRNIIQGMNFIIKP